MIYLDIWLLLGVATNLLLVLLLANMVSAENAKPARSSTWAIVSAVPGVALLVVAWPFTVLILIALNSRLPKEPTDDVLRP